jgi:hypothetical protein
VTKVEELLQEINDTLEDTANSLNPSFHRGYIGLDDVLAALISAARQEGTEQERMRIWMLRDMVSGNPNDKVIFVPVKALMLSSSVITPEKEMTKDEAEAQHKIVEQFTRDIDKMMIDAINFRPNKGGE